MTELSFALGIAICYAAYWMMAKSRRRISTAEWLQLMKKHRLGVK